MNNRGSVKAVPILNKLVGVMEYSKIVSVEITNFMVFAHAKVVFDEDENVINIKGYNGAGKTTVHRAIAVCLANMYSRDQVKLIKHNEEYFRVVVSFDDGVSILRDKYINGQSLYEMYRGGKKLFSTKVGNRLTKVDKVPDCIESYLGLCTTKFGSLNFLSRDTNMWLVETTGSENYYSLHEALKTEEIARANALLNSDKNKLGGDIAEIEAELQEATILLNNCCNVTQELVSSLESREEEAQSLHDREVRVCSLLSIVDEYLGVVPPPQVDFVDDTGIKAIKVISFVSDSLLSIPKIPEILGIDTSKESLIERLLSIVDDIPEVPQMPEIHILDDSRAKGISSIYSLVGQIQSESCSIVSNQIGELPCEELKDILFINGTVLEYSDLLASLKELDSELESVQSSLESVVNEAKLRGIKFVKCKNCGTYMEVGSQDGV